MSARQHAPQAQQDAASLRAAAAPGEAAAPSDAGTLGATAALPSAAATGESGLLDGTTQAEGTTLVDVEGTMHPLPGPLGEGALLVVDVQRSFADPAHLPWLDEAGLAAVDAAVTRTAWLVDQARSSGVPVVWVALEQLPDSPWLTSLWLRGLDEGTWPVPDEPCVLGTPGAEWFRVGPLPGETVVPKRRYSGFLGTGLEAHLRETGVTWVVAAGLTSECCVDGTVRDAFQLGFRAVMTSDATAAYDAETHTHALSVLAQNAAVVATSASVAAAWVHAAAAAAGSVPPSAATPPALSTSASLSAAPLAPSTAQPTAPPSATAPSPSTVAVAEPIPAGRP
ncbi:isochorismatase family protein [Sanguibacter sp. 4.1]|uniref:Isochorismatase family protein n=1 Tax=Sanguibacter biliveldensis TaxID=3030830 RepID=A0AAF1BY91_9MICO|nr:isochorismatase family protein [Sanguibacter sp. 4.1]WPF82591.1 isochorismatase family protein [Sanguibacter sp. 4.1]